MKGIPNHWTTLQKLIWLQALQGGGGGQLVTITGVSPLALANSLAHSIRSLTQYGKCVQEFTPTPSAPADIVCNNGALKFGKPLTLDPTRYYAYISMGNTWAYSTDSYSIVVAVTVGKKYKITADPTTPIDGGVVNVILRWGFVDTVYDDWKQPAVAPPSTSVTIYDWIRSTPQDTQSVEVTATHPFMVIQMGAAAFKSNLANGRIGVAVQEIYTDGTPETLTVSADGAATQTVTNLPMLLSVGDYKDEGELISGIKTGKVGIKVLDGTETWIRGEGTTESSFYVYSENAISNRLIGATGTLVSHFEALQSSIIGTTGKCYLGLSTQRVNFTIAPTLANSVTAFKQWLAAQYAAGTPVIVIYPLATETTEQATPHSLHSYAGTTVVEAETNVDPVELSAEYMAGAA